MRLPHVTALLLALAIAASGCGTDRVEDMAAEQATACYELGGELVYIRYETADGGSAGYTQLGLDGSWAEAVGGLSEQMLRVLEARGWDDEALRELEADGDLSEEVTAKLEQMPSCFDALREQAG